MGTDSVDYYLAASERYQTQGGGETAEDTSAKRASSQILQASAAQQWQMEPLGRRSAAVPRNRFHE
jgi:hypothetical protein